MENIIQPENMVSFDFSSISLKNPKPIQGGSFLSSIKCDGKPLIIQTPKIKTKKGITHTNKHVYADLVFENDDIEFIEWIENLQEVVRDIILKKSENWFHEPVTLDEIEYNWNNSLRTYKQTKQLLRTFIHKNKGISSSVLKIYDCDYNTKHINDITNTNSIISILEIIGLKFSSTSFQLDFCMRQVMILEDKPIFNEPLIQLSTKKVVKENNGEKNVSFKEPVDEITLEKEEPNEENLENKEQEIEDVTDISLNKIEDNTKTEINNELDDNKEIIEMDKNVSKVEPIVENLEEIDISNNTLTLQEKVNEEDVPVTNNEISEFSTKSTKEEEVSSLENLENNKSNKELEEVNLILDENDAITLKNPNEIYLDIYRQAREKAKKAKQQAIKAYLEAKRIKELYMLEIVDSSDDEIESSSSEDGSEDELFSEN